jgi:hypothetical protein
MFRPYKVILRQLLIETTELLSARMSILSRVSVTNNAYLDLQIDLLENRKS